MSLQDLIARLEKATGPDRQLDNAIEAFIDHRDQPSQMTCYPPYYTSSLDAALTLVPEGLRVSLVQIAGGGARAGIQKKGAMIHLSEAVGATLALALSIAALKARTAQSEKL